MTLRVLHVIPSVAPCRGGPSKAVVEMVKALNHLDVNAEIATTNDACESVLNVDLNGLSDYARVPVRFFARYSSSITSIREFQYSNSFRHWLKAHIQDYDLIHVHAIFSFCSSYAMTLARKKKIPYVVRPIGQLEDWALQQKSLKKNLYLSLCERKNLVNASLVHFTAESEQQQALASLPLKSSSIIPLGIVVPDKIPNASEHLHASFDIPAEHTIITYLSRIHKKKGLDLLLKALAKLEKNNVCLLIAGDGDKSYLRELKELATKLGLNNQIKWLGFIEGKQKELLLQGADLYALTSHSENFGIAVLEALASGTPVLVTKAVALATQVSENDLGYVTDTNVDAITDALQSALRSPQKRKDKGLRCNNYIEKHYQWPNIAQSLVESYQRILKANT